MRRPAATAKSCPCCCARRTTRCRRPHGRRRSGSQPLAPAFKAAVGQRARSARSPTRPAKGVDVGAATGEAEAGGGRRGGRRHRHRAADQDRERRPLSRAGRTKGSVATGPLASRCRSERALALLQFRPGAATRASPDRGDLGQRGQGRATAQADTGEHGDVGREWIPLARKRGCGFPVAWMLLDADALIERSRQLAATPLGDRDRLASLLLGSFVPGGLRPLIAVHRSLLSASRVLDAPSSSWRLTPSLHGSTLRSAPARRRPLSSCSCRCSRSIPGPRYVPLCVMAGLLLGGLPEYARGSCPGRSQPPAARKFVARRRPCSRPDRGRSACADTSQPSDLRAGSGCTVRLRLRKHGWLRDRLGLGVSPLEPPCASWCGSGLSTLR